MVTCGSQAGGTEGRWNQWTSQSDTQDSQTLSFDALVIASGSVGRCLRIIVIIITTIIVTTIAILIMIIINNIL